MTTLYIIYIIWYNYLKTPEGADIELNKNVSIYKGPLTYSNEDNKKMSNRFKKEFL